MGSRIRGTFTNTGACGCFCAGGEGLVVSPSVERIGLRAVGGSGVSISPVGLGGFEVGPQPGEDPDVDRAVAVIEAALAAGMNWLDTSETTSRPEMSR